MGVREIKNILDGLGARPRKGLGQHFLVDGRVAERHVALAAVKPCETILEIGPGLGVLTERLLPLARRVVAIETDKRMHSYLQGKLGYAGNLELILGDALDLSLPRFDACVSNLPYRISSPITFKLLHARFHRALLMYQLEFAERMVAQPSSGAYSRLSVMAQHRAACSIAFRVLRSAFWPRPRVNSAVVLITPRPPPYVVDDERLFESVVKVLFTHRRKKIRTALVNNARALSMHKDSILEALRGTKFGDERVENLSPEEIAELANLLDKTR